MKTDNFHLYVSKDIIQKELVPFFILWKSNDVVSIKIELMGFSNIVEFHNLIENAPIEDNIVKIEFLKSKNYFGGLLKTEFKDKPFEKASLKAIIKLYDGSELTLCEERILHSTILSIKEIPEMIHLPVERPPFIVELKGQTTIFVDIESDSNSEVLLDLPDEVKIALLHFISVLIDSLKQLLPKYPQYEVFINSFLEKLENPKKATEKQYFDSANVDLQELKNDIDFVNDFGAALLYSMQSHTSIREVIFKPFIEYIEGFATTKCYLSSPFLCINPQKGKSKLKIKLSYQNLLEKEGILKKDPLQKIFIIDTEVETDEQCMIPIKNLFSFQRNEE